MVMDWAAVKRCVAWLFRSGERMLAALARDLGSVLPPSAMTRLAGFVPVMMLEISPDDGIITAVLPNGRRLGVAPSFIDMELELAARRHLVALRVPDTAILSTSLNVPRGAASRLDEVVANNIAVWTPFAADAIFFKARITKKALLASGAGRDPTCRLELRCVPKHVIDSWLACLAQQSLGADTIWLGPDARFSIPLESSKRQKWRRCRQVVATLVGLAVLQAIALAGLERTRQTDEIADLTTRLDHIRTLVHARGVRQQNAQAVAATLAGIKARATGPDSATYALRRLAGVLPAGASYRALNLDFATGGTLTIQAHTSIDPVAIVTAIGILSVMEVNELGGPRDGEHIYSVAFRPVSAKATSD